MSTDRSRPAVIALSVFTLRLMNNWREALQTLIGDESDVETVMIVVSVIAIGAEKFMRGGLDPKLYDLTTTMPSGMLTKCNLNSIAMATGLNREKVRRRVDRLQLLGVLDREENGAIRVRSDVTELPKVQKLVAEQVDAVRRLLSNKEFFTVTI